MTLLRRAGHRACARRPTAARSPLADEAAHGILVAGLRRLDPSTPVISEEARTPSSYETRRDWRRFWLVDPLDGTKEFIKRRAEFTVNVALIEDGEPVLGVVLAPALDLLYWAEKGAGAWREDKGSCARADHSTHAGAGHSAHGGRRAARIRRRSSRSISRRFRWPAGSRRAARSSSAGWPMAGPTSIPASARPWSGTWPRATASTVSPGATASGPSPLTYNKPDLRNPSFVIGL